MNLSFGGDGVLVSLFKVASHWNAVLIDLSFIWCILLSSFQHHCLCDPMLLLLFSFLIDCSAVKIYLHFISLAIWNAHLVIVTIVLTVLPWHSCLLLDEHESVGLPKTLPQLHDLNSSLPFS